MTDTPMRTMTREEAMMMNKLVFEWLSAQINPSQPLTASHRFDIALDYYRTTTGDKELLHDIFTWPSIG